MTGSTASRNLDEISQERMFKIAFFLWERSPLTKWLSNLRTSFVIPTEFPYVSADDNILNSLKNFWNDPVNNLELDFEQFVEELGIFGELYLPIFISENTGILRLGYIDPQIVADIITDPENCRIKIGIILKSEPGKQPKKYKIYLDPKAVISTKAQNLRNTFNSGECLYYNINSVTNSPRGRSDFLTVADWIDIYEELIYNHAEKWIEVNLIVWDLVFKGTNASIIEAETRKFVGSVRQSNGAYGHSDNIDVKAHSPDVNAPDLEKIALVLRNHILGSFGYPAHWYGSAGDINKATSQEMTLPAFKLFNRRQKLVKKILFDLASIHLSGVKKYNSEILKNSDIENFATNMPNLSMKDIATLGAVIKNIADGLAVISQQDWIDESKLSVLFNNIFKQLGVE